MLYFRTSAVKLPWGKADIGSHVMPSFSPPAALSQPFVENGRIVWRLKNAPMFWGIRTSPSRPLNEDCERNRADRIDIPLHGVHRFGRLDRISE
jgi:hypothetical protein